MINQAMTQQAMTKNNDNQIRVMLVDDHALVRVGFRTLLDDVPGVAVIAECDSADSAIKRYGEVSPDVVIMDLGLPGKGV